jgi:hypothetical protein
MFPRGSQYSAEENIFLGCHPYTAPILIGDLHLPMNVTAAGYQFVGNGVEVNEMIFQPQAAIISTL